MDAQEKIIKNYPLVNKIDCELDCYLLDKRRYLVFWDELIRKDSTKEILKYLEEKTRNSKFTKSKTLIVVGKTIEEYKKQDLVYFNNVDTFVVFYLINEKLGKIYMDDSWIFTLGLNYQKYVRKINEVLSN